MISRASFAIGGGRLPASEGLEVVWNFFKTTTLSVAGERLGVRRMARVLSLRVHSDFSTRVGRLD